MTQRREQRARRERISRAIADYRNFNLTIEAAAEQAGMTVDEFRAIVQGQEDKQQPSRRGSDTLR